MDGSVGWFIALKQKYNLKNHGNILETGKTTQLSGKRAKNQQISEMLRVGTRGRYCNIKKTLFFLEGFLFTYY